MDSQLQQQYEQRIKDLEKQVMFLNSQIKQQEYGLRWLDCPEAFEREIENKLPILEEVPELAIKNNDGKPTHILIEGDNFHALTCLNYTHKGKVDVIYIDPPYNTDKGEFVYKDKRVLDKFPDGQKIDSKNPLRHSYWLSFMHKRLKLAKNLLCEKGVIFISIDDNEQANLKILCDQIFGERNFVGQYFWKRTSTPPALSNKIRKKIEPVLCYEKKSDSKRIFAQGLVDGGDAPLLNNGNPLGTLVFPAGSIHFNIPDGSYTGQKTVKIENVVNVVDGLNANELIATGHFKWGQNNLNQEILNGTYFLVKGSKFSIRYQKSSKSTKVPSNIIDEEVGVGTNEEANTELNSIGNFGFNYAKPTSLVSFLMKMPFWDKKDIVVLDFFAGSGTTLDATMHLNDLDKGKRQCILVTNNENNICREVTYVRNKKIIQGYKSTNGEQITGLGNSLRYYKTSFVGNHAIGKEDDKDKIELALNAGCLLALCENTLNEIVRKDFYQVYTNDKNVYTAIYFREDEDELENFVELCEMYRNYDYRNIVNVYFFSWGGADEFKNEFESTNRIFIKAIPCPILKIYRSINDSLINNY